MIEIVRPEDIEKRSFEIIKSELTNPVDKEVEAIVLRAIHTSADFEYAHSMRFSEGVLKTALSAIHKGVDIVSDTNMVKAGVDKTRLAKFGINIHCFVADEDVADMAKKNGSTRSKEAVDKAARLGRPVIYAVGNAPTALIRICEIQEQFKPEFVIGVPVGFVNVLESKQMLMSSGIPYITNVSRKGGSNIAAAICNALLRMAEMK